MAVESTSAILFNGCARAAAPQEHASQSLFREGGKIGQPNRPRGRSDCHRPTPPWATSDAAVPSAPGPTLARTHFVSIDIFAKGAYSALLRFDMDATGIIKVPALGDTLQTNKYANTDFAALRLIACEATFDYTMHQYLANTLAFASSMWSQHVVSVVLATSSKAIT